MVAKQEPVRKKRGRKALPPELKALRQAKGPRKLLKPTPKELPMAEPKAGVKKPLQPASFTYTGLGRSSGRDGLGAQNKGSFSLGGAIRGSLGGPGSGRTPTPAPPSLGRPAHARGAPDFKLSVSDVGGGAGLDLKMAATKSPGVAALNLHNAKAATGGAGQAASPQIGGPANGQRRPEAQGQAAVVPPRAAGGKLTATPLSPPKGCSNQALSLQALNLQSVSKPAGGLGAPGAATPPGSNLRSGGALGRKAAGAAPRQGQPKPVAPGAPQSRKGPTEREDGGELGSAGEKQAKAPGGRPDRSAAQNNGAPPEGPAAKAGRERAGSKDGGKQGMSAGEDASSSDSDRDSPSPGDSRHGDHDAAAAPQDWKPPRSLIEHVFVTDVTANLVTVTVKESPTSVGFFNVRHY